MFRIAKMFKKIDARISLVVSLLALIGASERVYKAGSKVIDTYRTKSKRGRKKETTP